MRLGDFHFQPSLLPSLATVLVFPILLMLGFWQLERAEQKDDLRQLRDTRQRLDPLEMSELAKHNWESLRYRRVRLRGTYDSGHSILLDNQIHQGKPGYQVLTPLRAADRDFAVLINRGWVPIGPTREQLPDTSAPGGVIDGEAYLDRPSRLGLRLSAETLVRDDWPLMVLEIEVESLQERIGYALYPLVAFLSPETVGGYLRDWRGTTMMQSDRHRSYALQWFSLAGALLIIYVLVNLRRARQGAGVVQ